jgi:hypothetical protein
MIYTNTTQNINNRAIPTTLKIQSELRCYEKVSRYCSTCRTRRIILITNPLISHEWGQDRNVSKNDGSYRWLFVTQIFLTGLPSHGGDCKSFEVMTSTTWNSLSVPLLLAATLYEAIHDRTHKLYNIGSTERCIFHMQVVLECWGLIIESMVSNMKSIWTWSTSNQHWV